MAAAARGARGGRRGAGRRHRVRRDRDVSGPAAARLRRQADPHRHRSRAARAQLAGRRCRSWPMPGWRCAALLAALGAGAGRRPTAAPQRAARLRERGARLVAGRAASHGGCCGAVQEALPDAVDRRRLDPAGLCRQPVLRAAAAALLVQLEHRLRHARLRRCRPRSAPSSAAPRPAGGGADRRRRPAVHAARAGLRGRGAGAGGVLVWNNHGYGEIKAYMADRGIPQIGVDIYTPDFVAIASGYGLRGVAPTEPRPHLRARPAGVGDAQECRP